MLGMLWGFPLFHVADFGRFLIGTFFLLFFERLKRYKHTLSVVSVVFGWGVFVGSVIPFAFCFGNGRPHTSQY